MTEMTAEEIEAIFRLLEKQGLLIDTGDRKIDNGKLRTVWRATQDFKRYLRS
jgi:hypothetical protein